MPRRNNNIDYEPVGNQLFRSKEEVEQEARRDSLRDMSPEHLNARTHEPLRVRMSYNIREEQDLALEEIQAKVRRQTGKKPTKSELAEEAFDLLIEKYGV